MYWRRTNSLLVRFAFADAPAIQVLKPSDTRPRLNAVGEMLTAFPPTSTVMEMLNVQGSSVLNVYVYVLTDQGLSWALGQTERKTSVLSQGLGGNAVRPAREKFEIRNHHSGDKDSLIFIAVAFEK
jgi:hypothetical protein